MCSTHNAPEGKETPESKVEERGQKARAIVGRHWSNRRCYGGPIVLQLVIFEALEEGNAG